MRDGYVIQRMYACKGASGNIHVSRNKSDDDEETERTNYAPAAPVKCHC